MKEQLPKTHELGSGGIIFLTVIVTGLTTAFMGNGPEGDAIRQFSDINQIQYAVIILGGVAAFLKDIGSQRKESTKDA